MNVSLEFMDRRTGAVLKRTAQYNTLTLESTHPGGFSRASIEILEDVFTFPRWARRGNEVRVLCSGEVAWQGTINVPTLKDPSTVDLECLGWSTALTENGSRSNLPAQTGKAFVASMLGSAECILEAGDIVDDADSRPSLECIPYKTWDEIVSWYASQNDNWHYGVWENRRFYWRPVNLNPTYWVRREDMINPAVAPEGPPYANRVVYTYTVGSAKITGLVEDTTEQESFGRVVTDYWAAPDGATSSEVQSMASARLDYLMHPAARGEIKVRKIYKGTPSTQSYPMPLVRAGETVCIIGYLPVDPTIMEYSRVNELTAFVIKEASYEAGTSDEVLTLTPTDYNARLDVLVARRTARQSVLR